MALSEAYSAILQRALKRSEGSTAKPFSTSSLAAEVDHKRLATAVDAAIQRLQRGGELLRRYDGTPLRRAIKLVESGASSDHDLARRRWSMRLLIVWALETTTDLGSLDEVTLREAYLPFLAAKYTAPGPPMTGAHRLLEAIMEVKRDDPSAFPPLATWARATPWRPPRRIGTDLLSAVHPDLSLAKAAASVVDDAAKPTHRKVRRYALGQFLNWCVSAGIDPAAATLEDVDGLSFWLRGVIANSGEVGVHVRKMLHLLAAIDQAAEG